MLTRICRAPRKLCYPIVVVIALLLGPSTAQAQYLDPGAGSVLVQVLIAVVVGASAVVKIYWGRISGFFSRRSGPSDSK